MTIQYKGTYLGERERERERERETDCRCFRLAAPGHIKWFVTGQREAYAHEIPGRSLCNQPLINKCPLLDTVVSFVTGH